MIIKSNELFLKYKEYKNPKDKIKREIDRGKYFRLKQGIYEDDIHVAGYLLACVIESPSYLSFEYALSKQGLIPERVQIYTSATTSKKHNKLIKNIFGEFHYSDVPLAIWNKGIKIIEENGYTYLMATPEKALCDLLYKKAPVYSIKQLKELLFEDLRIDEEEFYRLNFDDMISICDDYKKKNLNFLKKYLKGIKEDE